MGAVEGSKMSGRLPGGKSYNRRIAVLVEHEIRSSKFESNSKHANPMTETAPENGARAV